LLPGGGDELVDAVGGMGGDAHEDVSEVVEGVDVFPLAALD
jgi:hypothetical protein